MYKRQILTGIPDETIIDITVSEPVLADVNNLPMHTEGLPHSFYVGQPPVGCTIENVSGQLVPGGSGTFEIHMENTETVNILELGITDMPDYMTVTNIIPLNRFEDGTIDGSSGEAEDGSFYFLGYDFSTAIEPDTGAILEVEVQFNNNLINPSVVFMINMISAGDVNANPITAIADNFGQFSSNMLAVDENERLPGEFALHPNYPNPFNPSTVISYDIANSANVSLSVYDMRGRVVNDLVRKFQDAGRYSINWYGNDKLGNQVSAGVYIYKLQAGSKVISRKMVLMK